MTRVLPRRVLPFAVLLFALLAMAGCKGNGQRTDLTAGEINSTHLASMMLSLEDYGPDFRDFRLDKDSGPKTAAKMAEDDTNPQDEAQDLERFGFESDYERSYSSQQATQDRSGFLAASSEVAVFKTAEGAAGYLKDDMAELAALAGTSAKGFTVDRASQFDAHVADEAFGVHFDCSVQADDGSQIHVLSTGVIARRGRLLATAVVTSSDERDTEEQAKGLARMLDQRIVDVLQAKAVGEQGSQTLVMRPGAVLATSAERFNQEVRTFQGTFDMDMGLGDSSMTTKGTFAFRSPDTMYMTMNIFGKTVEYLMVLPDMYMRFPNEGWYIMTGESLGIDRDAFRKYLDNRGPVDYAGTAPQLKNLTQLTDETVDGVTYLHYEGTLDLAQLTEEIPQGIFDPATMEQVREFMGPVSAEVWVDKDTYLPHRVHEKMTFNVQGSTMSIDMSMEFSGFNEPVTIPEPPADAQPLGAGRGSGL